MNKFKEEAKLKIGDAVWIMLSQLITDDNGRYINQTEHKCVKGEVVMISSHELSDTLVKYAQKCKDVMNKGYNDTITDEEQPYRKYVNSNILSLIKASTDDDNDEEDGLINYTILCKAVPTSWFQMSQTTNKQKFEMITKTLPQHFLNETFVKKDDKDILEKKCKELNKLNKLQAKANQTQWA